MTSENPSQDTGHVLRFERRGIGALRGRTPFAVSSRPHRSPVEDIDKFAYRNDDADDDRRRMIANAVAAGILLVLIACGIWLADTIGKMRASQDCALSGRSNCAPIERLNRSR
jgi:hypothetical protein